MGDDQAFVFELLFHQVPHLVDGNLSLITKHQKALQRPSSFGYGATKRTTPVLFTKVRIPVLKK
jgi:hypothetical protein